MDIAPVLAAIVPALGGIGVWIVWKLSKGFVEDREELRRRRMDDCCKGRESERLS